MIGPTGPGCAGPTRAPAPSTRSGCACWPGTWSASGPPVRRGRRVPAPAAHRPGAHRRRAGHRVGCGSGPDRRRSRRTARPARNGSICRRCRRCSGSTSTCPCCGPPTASGRCASACSRPVTWLRTWPSRRRRRDSGWGMVGGFYDDIAHELLLLDGVDEVLAYLLPVGRPAG